jgi:pSer/pThr/pTyr-binding forkhead associated (FHA) protein
MAQTIGPGPQNDTPERTGTVLETDEGIRRALLSGRKGQQQSVPVEPTPNAGRPASSFRPTIRPPTPTLTVFDDGRTDGAVIRLRQPKFTIGRTEGDLRFPMDGRMSARHVEITRQVVGGLQRWAVTDLQSTHGTFVRVSRTALADKAEFLVGNGRYRFDAGQPDRDVTADHVPRKPAPGETQGWADGPSSLRPPALTEVLGREIGSRVLLVKDEYWIGSEPTCAIWRPDDPFCEARHVRIFRGPRGGWYAEHNRTQNGIGLRMTQIMVDSTVQFQVGEQRFKLKAN